MEGLGSAPPSMEDSRVLDASSLQPGYEVTVSDADSAYLQAFCDSAVEVWVELPYEYWEDSWKTDPNLVRPMVRLVLALYGHADSGGYWERKSYGDLAECGWIVAPERRGVFYKKAEHGIAWLMVYVDDFKMSSHKKDTANLWRPIREKIRMADPAPSARFLGCYSRRFTAPVSTFAALLGQLPKQWVRHNADGTKCTKPQPWKPKDPNRIVHGYEYEMNKYSADMVETVSYTHLTLPTNSLV